MVSIFESAGTMKQVTVLAIVFGINLKLIDAVLRDKCKDERILDVLTELTEKFECAENGYALTLEPYKWKSLPVSELEVDGWQMVFRANAGNGHSAYAAWTAGNNVGVDKPMSMDRSNSLHYRHQIVPNWANIGVKFVKFALYDHDKEVAYVVFNGVGSDMNNWFSSSRVLSSSFSGLTSTATYNLFSIDGHFTSEFQERRFHIGTKYAGCDGDIGYFVSIEPNPGIACPWDNHPSYPQFLYSMINGPDYWNRRQFGRADFLAIFIKLK